MDKFMFKRELEKNGINLTKKQIKQFESFLEILKRENKKYNLTSITNDEEIYEKHFFDSLSIAFKISFENQRILDIGTGAGFPSIPLKIVFPNLKITSLDSTKKKIAFLEKIKSSLDLKDFFPIHERAEIFSKQNKEKYNLVLTRATGPLPIVLEIAVASLKINGLFIAWKGKKASQEIKESKNACTILNISYLEKQDVVLPFSGIKRYNLIYKKIDSTLEKYPRQYKKIKKNIL